jgi:hypothetical protein
MKCLVTVLFFLWVASYCSCRLISEATGRRFNVLDYGADGNGKIDATPVRVLLYFFSRFNVLLSMGILFYLRGIFQVNLSDSVYFSK